MFVPFQAFPALCNVSHISLGPAVSYEENEVLRIRYQMNDDFTVVIMAVQNRLVRLSLSNTCAITLFDESTNIRLRYYLRVVKTLIYYAKT